MVVVSLLRRVFVDVVVGLLTLTSCHVFFGYKLLNRLYQMALSDRIEAQAERKKKQREQQQPPQPQQHTKSISTGGYPVNHQQSHCVSFANSMDVSGAAAANAGVGGGRNGIYLFDNDRPSPQLQIPAALSFGNHFSVMDGIDGGSDNNNVSYFSIYTGFVDEREGSGGGGGGGDEDG